MTEQLTIVFRLRFAVALSVAICLVLAFYASNAASSQTRGEYIVQMQPGSSPAHGKQLVERLGGRVTSPTLSVINGFGATLTSDDAARLAADSGVHAVSPNGNASPRAVVEDPDAPPADTPLTADEEADLNGGDDDTSVETDSTTSETKTSGGMRCPVTDATTRASKRLGFSRNDRDPAILSSLRRITQPLLRSTRSDLAWLRSTGAGVSVAVIDTGIAGDHADFQLAGGRGSRVIASAVTNPCASDANDHFGHGTHVAGLIAGNSLNSANKQLRGRYMGVAPRANLVSVKVSDDDGATTVLDVIYGIQFAVEHKNQFGIRVINLSLSSTVAESPLTDPLDAAVESAWFNGLVVVAAAGNEGAASDAVSYAPANDPYVITAGGLDDRGTWTGRDDVLAPWSSRGLTQTGVRKPEVLAPGARLVSTLAPGSDFANICPSCVVDRDYFRVSGTSMSAAVVSGVAALIVAENPSWTPNQVKGAMLATLRDVPGVGATVDASAALRGYGPANVGLTRNTLLDPVTSLIDWNRVSFRRASFRDASGSPFQTSWSRASFRCDCGLTDGGEVEPNRVSFRRVSFRRTSDFDR
jgi:serine protease AprX